MKRGLRHKERKILLEIQGDPEVYLYQYPLRVLLIHRCVCIPLSEPVRPVMHVPDTIWTDKLRPQYGSSRANITRNGGRLHGRTRYDRFKRVKGQWSCRQMGAWSRDEVDQLGELVGFSAVGIW